MPKVPKVNNEQESKSVLNFEDNTIQSICGALIEELRVHRQSRKDTCVLNQKVSGGRSEV
jgi:hypothetical protein